MGVVKGISFTQYPKQRSRVGKRVSVCYNYNTKERHEGTVIRDDVGEPHQTIFHLDNGRILLATECQYYILPETVAGKVESERKRYVVWFQDGRSEAIILDNPADLRYLLTGDTSAYAESDDIGMSIIVDALRMWLRMWLMRDTREVIVQEFNLDEFDLKAMLSMRREKLVTDAEQDSEEEED